MANPPLPAPRSAAGCTCFRLRSLSRQVTQFYDRALAPSGLKVTQYSLLAHARRPPDKKAWTMSELARRLVTDRTTLTRNLKPLVDAGLLDVAAGADRRSRSIVVTAKGEQAYQSAHPLWKRAQAGVLERVGDESLASLHALIDDFLPRFEEEKPHEA